MQSLAYTAAGRFRLWDDVNQRWSGWSSERNLLSCDVTIPEPTLLLDHSNLPDSTFGAELDAFAVPTGSPTVSISTRDLLAGSDRMLLEAALQARTGALDGAQSAVHFSAYVDSVNRAFWTGIRNLNTSATVVHVRAALDGAMTGQLTSATETAATLTGAGWTEDELIGSAIMITGGTGAGQVVTITDNTATEITVADWPEADPDGTSTFAIVEATALTAGADFNHDMTGGKAKYGTLTPIAGGAIATGDTLEGFATSYAITGGTKLYAGERRMMIMSFMGPGKELKSGTESWLYIPRMRVVSGEAQQFVTDSQNAALKVAVLTGAAQVDPVTGKTVIFEDGLTYASA